MKRPVRKIVDYLILTFIVSAAIVSILFFNGSKNFQLITIFGLSFLYITWGLVHHYREGNLSSKIALEYILFAILGTLLVVGLL